MAGVLPFYYDHSKKQFYYIIARESPTHPTAANEYSDFGGSKDGSESKLETACRECYEESMGFFGKQHNIKKNISHLPTHMQLSIKSYTSYLMYVPEGLHLDMFMNRHFDFIKAKAPDIINDDTNCIYEKDHFVSVTLEQLNTKYNDKLRRFYRGLIPQIDETKIYDYIFPHGTSLHDSF